MDIHTGYRTIATVSEQELAQYAERARIALERAAEAPRRPAPTTGSLACVPSTSH
jgi:hypothetical protein